MIYQELEIKHIQSTLNNDMSIVNPKLQKMREDLYRIAWNFYNENNNDSNKILDEISYNGNRLIDIRFDIYIISVDFVSKARWCNNWLHHFRLQKQINKQNNINLRNEEDYKFRNNYLDNVYYKSFDIMSSLSNDNIINTKSEIDKIEYLHKNILELINLKTLLIDWEDELAIWDEILDKEIDISLN